MKRFYLIALLVCGALVYNCTDETPEPAPAPVTPSTSDYILTAEVTNMASGGVEVNNQTHEVTIFLRANAERNRVRIKFVLAPGVTMVFPPSAEADYDLTTASTVLIKAGDTSTEYRITASLQFVNPETIGWTKVTGMGSLKNGISVYKAPDQMQGKNAQAYIAVGDINKGITFDVLGEPSGYKTPTQFYNSSGRMYPIVINGGYFASNISLSMIWRNGVLVTPNIQVDWRNDRQMYPMWSVFGRVADKVYRADWVYSIPPNNVTYAYPYPLPYTEYTQPSESYPAGAWPYEAITAIGAGPTLIKNGYRTPSSSWDAENFDVSSGIGPNSSNPRTAIGITGDGKLILFVCEGRNKTPNTPGYSFGEMANILMELGCMEAINLDGGGSSCMLVNGNETIKPSDGTQRTVASAVGLR
ncbi:MAG: phosphodiester glycosidase family protein [Prevotellaceae bacterium]|jgi:hypothetical protein|nr:phosphodiester glycosidase family protein [Prevotellaceae bacterium]